MSDRDFGVEVYRGLGHIAQGLGTISAAIARRYALGASETETASARR